MRGITVNTTWTRLSALSGAYFVVAVLTGVLYRTEGGLMVILSGLVALLVFLAFLSDCRTPASPGVAGLR